MYPNRHGGSGKGNTNSFMEALERLKEEYNSMQNQLQSQRMELEKLNQEKNEMHRVYLSYYEMSCSLNLEMHKQTELAKRYCALLHNMLPLMPPEQQHSATAAMDRAKQISMAELQQMAATSQAQQMLMIPSAIGMGGPLPMGAGLPGGAASLQALQAAMAMAGGVMRPLGEDKGLPARGRSSTPTTSNPTKKLKVEDEDGDLEIDVQNDDPAVPSTNGSSTPGARKEGMLGRTPLQSVDQGRLAGIAACFENGKPAYSFRADGTSFVPTVIPPDALTDPQVPKSLKKIQDLPHGEVVCAVAMAKSNKHIYTGGKGCVKIWEMGGKNEPLASLDCLKDNYIRSCRLYDDDSHLVVGGEAGNITLWDLERRSVVSELQFGSQACYALAIDQSTKQLFACCADGNVVVFDMRSREKIATLKGHQDGASCLDISRDGTTLWTGGLDRSLKSWCLRERTNKNSVDFSSQIFSLGCSPIDDWVAVGMENNTVEVVSTTHNEKYQLHRHDSCVLSLRYAHSGEWFVTTGKDNILNAWRAPYGALAVKYTEYSSVLSCDISHDDAFIVTGSGEKKATVYQVMYE